MRTVDNIVAVAGSIVPKLENNLVGQVLLEVLVELMQQVLELE